MAISVDSMAYGICSRLSFSFQASPKPLMGGPPAGGPKGGPDGQMVSPFLSRSILLSKCVSAVFC